MFDRYNITSEADLADVADLVAAFRLSKSATTASPTVPKTVPAPQNTNGPESLQGH
jgi:hypothetical protein